MTKIRIVGMTAKESEQYRTKINVYLVELDKSCDSSPKSHNWQSLVALKSKKEAIKFVDEFRNFVSSFDCNPRYEEDECFMRIRKIKLGAISLKVSRGQRLTVFDNIP